MATRSRWYRGAALSLGKAIRAGQERGEIRKPGDDSRTDLGLRQNYVPKASPKDFLDSSQAMVETYAMSDDVTPAEFEEALAGP